MPSDVSGLLAVLNVMLNKSEVHTSALSPENKKLSCSTLIFGILKALVQ